MSIPKKRWYSWFSQKELQNFKKTKNLGKNKSWLKKMASKLRRKFKIQDVE